MSHRWPHTQVIANRGNLKPHFDRLEMFFVFTLADLYEPFRAVNTSNSSYSSNKLNSKLS